MCPPGMHRAQGDDMRSASIAAVLLAALAGSPAAFSQSEPASPDELHGGPHAMIAPMPHETMKSSPGAAKAPFDLQFLDTMSAHHQSAIEMAQLAEQRAGHDELKKMAKKMIAEQQAEIRQMQDWKKQWYAGKGDAVNLRLPGMAASMKNMPMDKLEAASGAAFDTMFLQMMSRHHQGAIKMARTAATKASRPELKAMAGRMIEAQNQEVAQMAQWEKEWKVAAK
jgi:uncharacterized protein (DUF305 family)